jgi:hypothetical protein
MTQQVQTSQAKVGVGLEVLWRALTKELRFVAQKAIPNLVKDVELIEGDGGLGSVLLFRILRWSVYLFSSVILLII